MNLRWLVLALVAASATALDREPEPSWVAASDWQAPTEASKVSGDYEDLLKDTQINRTNHQTYTRFAYRLLTPGAVQDASNLSIEYAPDYQRVILHRLVLWRDGKAIDQSGIAFRSLHQEEDLSRALYDGRETWVGFLQDVRVGDVLDYSYTIEGENPIFGGRYADTYRLHTGYAVDQWKLRLIASPGQSPQVRTFGTSLRPITTTRAGLEETTWSAQAVPRLLQEENTPPDAVPGGRYVLSDWKTWDEVVRWALPDYTAVRSQAVSDLAASLTKGHRDAESKAQALLQYVQDKVRYLGLEVGVHSHRPHSPDTVLKNGFGDCKDKALLFVSLAEAVGIEAWPVLVHSRAGQRVSTDGPTPLAFNHVIAAIRGPEGVRFVDPTASFQGQNLGDQVVGDFHWGLEIRPGTEKLSPLPGASAGGRTLVETIAFDDYEGPATVTMDYTFRGWDAVYQRDRWSRMVIEDWKTSMAETLHDRHGSSQLTSGPELNDDQQANEFHVTFTYQVDELWTKDGEKQVSEYYPVLIGEMLYDPDSVASRSAPYWREHPVTVTQERRVELPTDWSIDPSSVDVEGPGFRLTVKGEQVNPRLIVFTDEYRSTSDRVSPSRWKDFLAALKKARHEVSWTLTHTPGEEDETSPTPAAAANPNALALGIGVLALMLFGWAAASQGSDF